MTPTQRLTRARLLARTWSLIARDRHATRGEWHPSTGRAVRCAAGAHRELGIALTKGLKWT